MRRKIIGLTAVIAAILFLGAGTSNALEQLVGPTGVIRYSSEKAFDGYTLVSPGFSKTSYLLDMEGNVVHKWVTPYTPGLYAELLPNGNLLRGGRLTGLPVMFGGSSGIVQEIDWNGKVVWEWKEMSPTYVQHHTFCRMPNGNTLVLGWEYKSNEEAIARGRDPKTLLWDGYPYAGIVHKGLWPDYVREVSKDGKVVWEWHVWDHIGKGPDKIDINFILPQTPMVSYMRVADWTHFNTVDYIPETDQIILNSRNFGEFYLINHKTGKIEYRWGNPCAYGKGRCPSWIDDGDQQLFGPHHVSRLANGNFLIFDNGWFRPEGNRSRVLEVDPKTDKVVWEFKPKVGNSFYTRYQGAAQRLPNGNTFITSSSQGHVFEVTGGKNPEVVWEWINPVVGENQTKCFLDDSKDTVRVTEEVMLSNLHRAYRYGKDYPGLARKDLTKKEPLAKGCLEMWKHYRDFEAATKKAK
jgi:hypothetical protein